MVDVVGRLRPDFERIRKARREVRNADRLRAHYLVESGLARELSGSASHERTHLYSSIYKRLFDNVPDHPQHSAGGERRASRIQGQADSLLKLLGPQSTYVEIGCGDAMLTKVIAGHVRRAIGVDVTDELARGPAPQAFEFLLSDGVTLALSDGSVDLVYSNQLMEHLHVDDALLQLREIHRILKPGGCYVCATPNRLTGPHDISVYFAYRPAGLHLREYDHRLLATMFRSVGFSAVRATVSLKGRLLDLPVVLVSAAESVFERLPSALRHRLALIGPVTNMLGVNLVGIK